MKKIRHYLVGNLLVLLIFVTACSENSKQNNKNAIKTYPEVEKIAIQHANQFANMNYEGMATQQKLFEVRAHEQDLRKAGLNEAADYYIKMFEKHLQKSNPELARHIITLHELKTTAIQYAQEYSKNELEGKDTKQKQSEANAYAQDLRNKGRNNDADYFINIFDTKIKLNKEEAIAKKHAKELANYVAKGKDIEEIISKIKAHEKDLRSKDLNDIADHYIKTISDSFGSKPELAKKIRQK